MDSATIMVTLPSKTAPLIDQQIIGGHSPSSTDVEEFRGVPYGIIPKRWESSTLRDRLPHFIFDATRHGPKCPQPHKPNNTAIFQAHLDYSSDVLESEFDCLNLFITRPSAAVLQRAGHKRDANLPVMIWIHGGGYGYGAGSDPPWDPARLVLQSLKIGKPFIAVYIKYRLNLFGFGASSDILEAQPDFSFKGCNFGLRDQHVALRWVSQNISAFGGDPERITVGGQSAGGNSVHALVLEAKQNPGKPLFQRAIIQSGAMGTVGPISIAEADQRWKSLYEHVQVTQRTPKEQVDFLRDMSEADLVRAAGELGWFSFPLVTENKTLTETPNGQWRLVLEPRSDYGSLDSIEGSIDILIGDCDAEGMIWSDAISKVQSYSEIRAIVKNVYASSSTTDAILEAYRLTPESSVPDLHHGLLQFMTDAKFGLPVHNARCSLASSNNAPEEHSSSVQAYRIRYTNPFSGPLQTLAHHCVDLLYIFDAFFEDLAKADSTHQALVEAMQQHWIDFIWDGCKPETSKCGVKEDEITVYGKDRIASVKRLREDPECLEREKRVELLAKDPASMKGLWGVLCGVIPRR